MIPTLEESYVLIQKFMEEKELSLMHIQMFLSVKHGIVCRSEQEDNEIGEELDRLRGNL